MFPKLSISTYQITLLCVHYLASCYLFLGPSPILPTAPNDPIHTTYVLSFVLLWLSTYIVIHKSNAFPWELLHLPLWTLTGNFPLVSSLFYVPLVNWIFCHSQSLLEILLPPFWKLAKTNSGGRVSPTEWIIWLFTVKAFFIWPIISEPEVWAN